MVDSRWAKKGALWMESCKVEESGGGVVVTNVEKTGAGVWLEHWQHAEAPPSQRGDYD